MSGSTPEPMPVPDVRVDVEPSYHEGESSPLEGRYVFTYVVRVHNHSTRNVQLVARYWRITQANGQVQEVRGKGVVGKQPLIAPDQSFSYTSRAIIDGPVGFMEGAYTCVDTASQRPFEVAIAMFRLATPNQIH